ncbi:type I-F CRISPR-associated endoribonuclease Cas6/Csy4 [Billgrantia sulfidoxydans]|uniref:Type I-F CRISPR-associated endoribonuclease Cas6/Csy4 n=1 Tax=Billgrantia sulfidoxydans TaxID=2733484 RepID=A0ABX7W4Q0_9GAMM|nr:type I-F CRISPR-associated endoribonuclease Cas6/Csy4 [Halomonas sulfidoxydans]QTP54690.1 type I-F CRISPR-associated endoribonuclease Cas6/Csy4 [Halomonas sulfidoxydans]
MNRYCFSINYLPTDSDCALLSGRCITALHYFIINNHPFDIGVSFPNWSCLSLGGAIDFFCEDKDKLARFQDNEYFSMMAGHDLFEVGEIFSVVCGEYEEVRFFRNQAVDKVFPGAMRRRLARAKKRAEKRGEKFDPMKVNNSRVVDSFHSSFLESQSTGQPFMIHIQLERNVLHNGGVEGMFNSYGLATGHKHKGTVPFRSVSKL